MVVWGLGGQGQRQGLRRTGGGRAGDVHKAQRTPENELSQALWTLQTPARKFWLSCIPFGGGLLSRPAQFQSPVPSDWAVIVSWLTDAGPACLVSGGIVCRLAAGNVFAYLP